MENIVEYLEKTAELDKEAFRSKTIAAVFGGKKTKAGRGIRNYYAGLFKDYRSRGPNSKALSRAMKGQVGSLDALRHNRKTLPIPGYPTEGVQFGLYASAFKNKNARKFVIPSIKEDVKNNARKVKNIIKDNASSMGRINYLGMQ